MNNFVFVIPYFNSGNDIIKTIHSMMAQSYDNWRAILIDDLSSDKTPDLVKEVCNSSYYKGKFSLVSNTEKHGEVRNTLKSIDSIDDQDVVCRLDGGDWLLENDLLWMMNSLYSNPKTAVAWTAHRWSYTTQNISATLNLAKGQTVYEHPWVSSHLKTFRCQQLRKVPEANFKTNEGEYIMIACDQAVFLPMMHMSVQEGMELKFLPVVAYHYNIDLSNKNLFTSQRAVNQKMSAEMIRARGFIS